MKKKKKNLPITLNPFPKKDWVAFFYDLGQGNNSYFSEKSCILKSKNAYVKELVGKSVVFGIAGLL